MLKMTANIHCQMMPSAGKGFGSVPAIPEPARAYGVWYLISKIKKLITMARIGADDEDKKGDLFRMINFRIAAAYAEQKLRDVVDGKVDRSKATEEMVLKEGIRVLEEVLYSRS